MSARLLERVERLATERFGQGAAVELGRKEILPRKRPDVLRPRPGVQISTHVCTVWRPDGTIALKAETAPDSDDNNRTSVLRLMLDQLQAEEVRT